jgi:uncharacterized protein YwgA
MKIFFILEHIDLEKKGFLSKPFLGNEFSIYHYGVYSETVMKDIYKLINDKILLDGFPLRLGKDIKENKLNLETRIKNKLDKIIEKFGKWSGYKLEIETLKILGLDLESKRKFIGFSIKEIIKENIGKK